MSLVTTESPTGTLRLAAVQAEAIPGDLVRNVAVAAAATVRAADRRARVIVLPELHLPAYDLPNLATSVVDADEEGRIADARLDPLSAVATGFDVVVLAGAAVRKPDGALTNSLVLTGLGESPRVVYDKQYLWHDEANLFRPGDRGACLELDGWRLGVGLCYDMSFPEHARSAAIAGAHAYLCPSAFVVGAVHRGFTYCAARALENTVYCVFSNSVGGPPNRLTGGCSAVFGPDGVVVAEAKEDSTELVVDLDPAAIGRVRGFLRMLDDYRAQTAEPTLTRLS